MPSLKLVVFRRHSDDIGFAHQPVYEFSEAWFEQYALPFPVDPVTRIGKSVSDHGERALEGSVIKHLPLVLEKDILPIGNRRAKDEIVLPILLNRDVRRAGTAFGERRDNQGVGQKTQVVALARGSFRLHQRPLIPFGLSDLEREVDQRY